ncbi:MAG: phosphoribosylamine--glycine ligase [bacterium]
MHIAIIGSGGREHALSWKLKQSVRVNKISILPGNGGTALVGTNVPIAANDLNGIISWCEENHPDFVVVGPEEPLSLGLVDLLEAKGFPSFGPSQQAAQIESSKAWSKKFMLKAGIPTGFAEVFEDYVKARQFVQQRGAPIVIKVDGLAAGKGVYVCQEVQQAYDALDEILLKGSFGDAGKKVIVEEFLEGREVSYLTFVDGKSVVPMRPVCDYKRVFDNDQGPNTGGMGVYSPPGFVSSDTLAVIQETIAERSLKALLAENIDFRGVLYIGIILTKDGPKVLEYNARFGDPETQLLLPALENDLLDVLQACRNGTLESLNLRWSTHAFCGVILASGGYPGVYEKGKVISGYNVVEQALVFHAGTKISGNEVVTDGGRVLCVVGEGIEMREAREKAYKGLQGIRFDGQHYRSDIALREL